MLRDDPGSWQIPQWDSVWNGDFQFTQLANFARVIIADTDLGIRLRILEVGYPILDVFEDQTKIGEVYANRISDGAADAARFAVFAGQGDDELQTTDVAEGVRFLSDRRTAFRDKS